jgi:hypothetical protein
MRVEASLTLGDVADFVGCGLDACQSLLRTAVTELIEFSCVSLALSEMWLMLTVISSIAAAIEEVASDCFCDAVATSRDAVLMLLGALGQVGELWPISVTMARIEWTMCAHLRPACCRLPSDWTS